MSGYAEFNDSTAVLRGIMVAGKGEFSGQFDSNNIDAISHINVRDGAISANYGLNFPAGSKSCAFYVPYVSEATLVDITIPIKVSCYQDGYPGKYFSDPGASIALSRNSQSLGSSRIRMDVGASFLQVIRFVDPDVSGETYYSLNLKDEYGGKAWIWTHNYEADPEGGYWVAMKVSLSMLGPVTLSFRKR